MVFNRIDRDVKSFAGGGLLAPVYKPPLTSDIFFPFPSNFTTPSSRFASYPSSKSSSEFFRFDASTTSNHPLSAPCVGQQQHFYDNLHRTTTNMDMNMDIPGGVTEQEFRDFWLRAVDDRQHMRRMGFETGELGLHPDLQLRFFGYLLEQDIESAPVVAEEPIAQGLQHNDALDFTYPEPEINNFTFVADQTANMVLPAEAPKVEQVPVEPAQSNTGTEGEPADFQDPTGLPKGEVPRETYEAIVYLSGLPVEKLALAMTFLQHNLSVKQNNPLIKQNDNIMADQEMDIDQPEQIDGIPDFDEALLNEDNDTETEAETEKPSRKRPICKEIYDIPPPDHNSPQSRDQYLLTCREKGFTYGEIKEVGGFTEAEPTLRGRYRTLTKEPSQRVRKPKWEAHDVALLRMLTFRWYRDNDITPGALRPPWLQIANEMHKEGSSYRFGSGTVSKKWARLYPHLCSRT